ncbi:MAG: hypothetical protein HN623_08620, partial [Bdellovibrionales bacterium]|nr:hypothetical protein [Bdellovibrionales bacterium]
SLFIPALHAVESDSTDKSTEQKAEPPKSSKSEGTKENKEQKPEEVGAEDTDQRYDYLSYSYAQKENEAITVVAGWEIEFEDTSFQQLQFHKIFDNMAAGLGVDFSNESKKAMRFSGLLGFDDYMLMVEQAQISGSITKDKVKNGLGKFENNKYLDMKFMTQKGDGAVGVQLYSYERPSVMRENGIVYFDPKAEMTFIAFGIEYDTVKKKMLKGKKMPMLDWYFYNTTMMGYGSMELSDQTRNGSYALAKPTTTNFAGFGLNGEYELGIVFAGKMFGLQVVGKVGYNYQIEGPIMFTTDSFSNSDDVEPTEQLVNQGVNLTLAASF